jgi:hypothetical protein
VTGTESEVRSNLGPMHTGFGVRGNADVSRANSITRVNFDYPLPFTPYAHRGPIRQNAGSSVSRGQDKENTASVDQGVVPTLKPSDDHISP